MKPTPKAQKLSDEATQKIEPGNGLNEQIRLRAYELYEQRGRENDHDVDDWLQSESELTPNVNTTAAAA